MVGDKENIALNGEQETALDVMMSGANVFLTGEAGTGKSTLVREFLRRCDRECVVLAPTGIAALNAGGTTIHSQMTLKPGCRVMLLANLGPTVVNGMTGTVKTIFSDPFTGADVVHVQWDNGETTIVSPYKWTVYDYISTDDGKIEQVEVGAYTQLPLKPAYAVTIHKSQGQTYELANLIADAVFAPGQLYVALSRVKHFERLYVAPGIKIYKLADPLVVRWYDGLQYDDFPVPEKINSSSQTLQTQPITPEQQKNRRGRKSTWRGEPTTIIRVPVRIADRLMLEAHRMIDEEVPQTI